MDHQSNFFQCGAVSGGRPFVVRIKVAAGLSNHVFGNHFSKNASSLN
jgi:hypothetical protein